MVRFTNFPGRTGRVAVNGDIRAGDDRPIGEQIVRRLGLRASYPQAEKDGYSEGRA